MPGWFFSRSAMTSARVAPSAGDLGLAAGVGAQDGRDTDVDAHVGAPSSDHSGLSRRGRRRGTRPGWADGRGRAGGRGDRVQGLEAVAGVEDDGGQGRVEQTGLDQLLRHADGHPARRLGEDALGAGQQLDRVDDLLVVDVLDGAAGAAGDVQHVRAVGRVADRQRLGDGVRLLRAYDVVAGLEGGGDRRAALGLGAEDLVRLVLDQPELDQLLQPLVDLRELGAGGDRDDELVRAAASRAARRSRTRGSWSPRRSTGAG